jgi:hypothetical protein
LNKRTFTVVPNKAWFYLYHIRSGPIFWTVRFRSKHGMFLTWTMICCEFQGRQPRQSLSLHRKWNHKQYCIPTRIVKLKICDTCWNNMLVVEHQRHLVDVTARTAFFFAAQRPLLAVKAPHAFLWKPALSIGRKSVKACFYICRYNLYK